MPVVDVTATEVAPGGAANAAANVAALGARAHFLSVTGADGDDLRAARPRAGGEVRMVDYVEDHSTSLLIERIRVGTGVQA